MQDTRVSGQEARRQDRERASRSGLTDPCMKVTGSITRLMEREDLFTLMVMSTMESGKMIRLTAMESIAILTELSMKVSGRTTSNTVMELRPGQMEPDTKDNTSKVKSKGKVSLLGLMDQPIRALLNRITFKAMASTSGLTVVFTRAPG